MTDTYGIPQFGKGGDSRVAYVIYEGRQYCLNILLRLMSSHIPQIVSKPQIIDYIDDLAKKNGIQNDQDWWDLAIKNYPAETEKVMAYMRICEDKASDRN